MRSTSVRSLLGAILLCAAAGLATQAAEPAGDVSFPTADGGTVVADLYGEHGRNGVVLAHGAAFNKESWKTFAEDLAARGYQVMAIDFRGYGKSTAGTSPDALFEDILAAVRYLHRAGAPLVAVIGASMGGGAAARAAAAAAPGEIDRLILLSPAPIADPERMQGKKLFIASREEPAAERIKEQYERAPEPKRLVLLLGTAHAQHILATDQAGRLTTAVADFLADR
jgi:pimeloyl-ACP methyl ester carboxylesterase